MLFCDEVISIIIRFLFFALILVGLGLFFRVILKMPFALLPGAVLCSLGITLYVAGILNCMVEIAWLICGVSIYSLIKYIKKGKAIAYLKKEALSKVLFLAGIMYLLYYAKGGVYADGDTLTHWGVIIREMHEVNRMPNFTTSQVYYQTYPTGIAGLIWFFTYIIGYSEGVTIFAQGLLVISLLSSLFVFVSRERKNERYVSAITIIMLFVYSIHYNVHLDDLKVDNLLPLLTLYSAASIFFYKKQGEKCGIVASCLGICMLPITKTSGLLFVLYVLLYEEFFFGRERRIPLRRVLVLYVVVPMLLYYLWRKHTSLVFLDADSTRHAVSLSSLSSVYSSRTIEEIRMILSNYTFRWLYNVSNGSHEWSFLALACFPLIIQCLPIRSIKKNKRVALMKLIVILGGYLLYKLSLLSMYIFNMSGADALHLGSYDRYMSSITILLSTIAVIEWLDLSFSIENRICLMLAPIILGMILFINPDSLAALKKPDYQKDGVYRNLKRIQMQYGIPEKGGRVLVYSHDRYVSFYVFYCFQSNDAWAIDKEAFERSCRETPDYYSYLIILDHDEDIDETLSICGYSLDEECIMLRKENNAIIT